MSARFLVLATVTLTVTFGGLAARAHHGRASYSNERISLEATVTEFKFINPHVQLFFDIENDAGEIEHWQGELTAPNKLARAGWTKSMFKPGDRLQISGRAARNDGHSVAIDEILTADGQTLPLWEILD